MFCEIEANREAALRVMKSRLGCGEVTDLELAAWATELLQSAGAEGAEVRVTPAFLCVDVESVFLLEAAQALKANGLIDAPSDLI